MKIRALILAILALLGHWMAKNQKPQKLAVEVQVTVPEEKLKVPKVEARQRPWDISIPPISPDWEERLNRYMYPFDDRFTYSFDYKSNPAEGVISGAVDWYWLLTAQLGLELPRDASRWVEDNNPFSTEWPEHPLVENTSELAIELTGMQGVDPFHNALLITLGAGTNNSAVAVRAANFLFYATTRYCVGRQENFENRVRAVPWGCLSLIELAAQVCEHFDIVVSPSAEEIMFRSYGEYNRRASIIYFGEE